MNLSLLEISQQEHQSELKPAYQSYLKDLNAHWRKAKHPQVNQKTGKPKSLTLEPSDLHVFMLEQLGEVANLMPMDRWHLRCYSPASSQTLLLQVLGCLVQANQWEEIQALFSLLECPTSLQFEAIVNRTHFDAVLFGAKGQVLATLEAKFTEAGFGQCSYPSRKPPACSGQWYQEQAPVLGCPSASKNRNTATLERYWQALENLVAENRMVPPLSPVPCPLNRAYQVANNYAETKGLHPHAVWIQISDRRNPYFGDSKWGWISELNRWKGFSGKLLSWQEIILVLAKIDPVLSQYLSQLHGFNS